MPKIKVKGLSIILLIASTLALMAGLVYIGLYNSSVKKVVEQKQNNVSYVLVNEDKGATFNRKNYNLGNRFVNLINQDTQNRWQTASRSVAEAGFKSGAYDAKIILPQDFSEHLLSLQSFSPQQAKISYEVRIGQNEIANAAIQEKVGEILNDFNQRIIQMYFSSILGNLFEAQRNVQMMVSGEQNTQTNLLDSVQVPFKSLPNSFTSVIGGSQSLEQLSKNWQTQQDNFTKQTLDMMTQSADGLKKQLTDLESYKNLQEKISSVNQKNAQTAVQSQKDSDTTAYKNLYDLLNASANNQFNNFYTTDAVGVETGVLAAFKQQAKQFSDEQTQRIEMLKNQIEKLKNQIATLEQQARDLVGLRDKIARSYFGDSSKTPTTATNDDVKIAILNLMSAGSPNQPKLAQVYLDSIRTSIGNLAITDLQAMVDKLNNNQLISNTQYKIYSQEFTIIQRYASDEQISMNTNQNFAYPAAKNDVYQADATYQNTVSFTLDTTKKNEIVLQSGTNVSINDLQNLCTTIEGQLNKEFSKEMNVQANVKDNGTNEIDISFLPVDTKLPSTPPQTVNLTTDMGILWTFSSAETQNSYNTSDYQWQLNGDTTYASTLSAYVNLNSSDKELKQDISPMLNQLQSLDQATEQIITIFGDSTASGQLLDNFVDLIKQNPSISIRDLATSESIYRRYGNLSDNEKKDLITSSLMDLFKEQGRDLYNKTQTQYDALLQSIGSGRDLQGSLNDLLARLTDPSYLFKEADKLQSWYVTAVKGVSDTYNTWKENPVMTLDRKEYTANTPTEGDKTIYFDTNTGNQLYSSFQSLIDSTKMQALGTQEGAAKITNIDSQFKGLTDQTSNVKQDTEKVLNNLNNLVADSMKKAKNNKDYSQNFDTVMKNARKGGADNKQVFQFLSSPLDSKGTFGATKKASVVPYFMTIIGFILVTAIGQGVRFIDKPRVLREVDKLLTPTRFWLNTPIVLKTVGIATVVGVVFSLLTKGAVTSNQMLPWISYAFLLSVIGILFVAYFTRQFPKLTLYLVGALIGIYLLLTPVLGMNIAPKSMVDWLFRFSPLQNVENGYTALINGYSIGWGSYLVLSVLLVLGVFLNFIVKSKTEKGQTE